MDESEKNRREADEKRVKRTLDDKDMKTIKGGWGCSLTWYGTSNRLKLGGNLSGS